MSHTRPPPDLLVMAERIAARLCHELSGPVGAVASALDASLGETPSDEAVAVARDSAATAVDRLRLLRAVFTGLHEPQGIAAFLRLANAAGGANFRVDAAGLEPDVLLPAARARLLLALLVLASESMPGGGVAALASDGNGGSVLLLAGRRAAWPADLAAILADPGMAHELLSDRELGPRRLMAPYAVLLAGTTGQRLSLLLGAGADPAPPLLVSDAPSWGLTH